jgi:hypothetical protein
MSAPVCPRVGQTLPGSKDTAVRTRKVTRALTIWAVCRLNALLRVGGTPSGYACDSAGSRAPTQITRRHELGFALTFYTEEGQCDLVGNNTPIFFVRDPSKFPDCQAAA